jgi:hypothetical protein
MAKHASHHSRHSCHSLEHNGTVDVAFAEEEVSKEAEQLHTAECHVIGDGF